MPTFVAQRLSAAVSGVIDWGVAVRGRPRPSGGGGQGPPGPWGGRPFETVSAARHEALASASGNVAGVEHPQLSRNARMSGGVPVEFDAHRCSNVCLALVPGGSRMTEERLASLYESDGFGGEKGDARQGDPRTDRRDQAATTRACRRRKARTREPSRTLMARWRAPAEGPTRFFGYVQTSRVTPVARLRRCRRHCSRQANRMPLRQAVIS